MSPENTASEDDVINQTHFNDSNINNVTKIQNLDSLANSKDLYGSGELTSQSFQSYTSKSSSSINSNVAFIKSYIDDPQNPIADRIKLWYSTIPTNVLNLYDLTGNKSSLFVLHGESLLLHIILRAYKIGFDFTELTSGQQTLQLFYLLERIVSDLVDSGGKFHIIFFDLYNDFFAGSGDVIFMSSFSLLRQILLYHAKFNFNIPVFEFKNWFDDTDWFDYLINNEPSCILLEEGSSFLYRYNKVYKVVKYTGKDHLKSGEVPDEYYEWSEISKNIDKFSFTTQSLIYTCMIKNIYVAYMFDMSKRSGGFQVHNVNFSRTITSSDISNNIFSLLTTHFNDLGLDSEDGDKVHIDLLFKYLDAGLSLRDSLSACCYKQFIELKSEESTEGIDMDKSEDVSLARFILKCLIVHNFLLEHLSLSDRMKLIESFIPNELMADWDFYNVYVCGYLDFSFQYVVKEILANLNNNDKKLKNEFASSSELVDLFDGKIFQRIVYDFGKQFINSVVIDYSNFPTVLSNLYQFNQEDTKKIVERFRAVDESLLDFFPIDPTNLEENLDSDNLPEWNQKLNVVKAEDITFTYMENNMLKYEFNVDWINFAPFSDSSTSISSEIFKELGYRDPANINQKKDVFDIYLDNQIRHREAEQTKQLSEADIKRNQRNEQRNLQRQKQLSFLMSKYLGSNNLHHPIVVQPEHVWLEIKKLMINSLTNGDTPKKAISSNPSKGNKFNKNTNKQEHTSKAELLRQKNIETQKKKKYDLDKQILAPYEPKLSQLSIDLNYGNIAMQILDLTAGSSRIGDMISDFKWVKSTFSTSEYQLKFLLLLMKNVHSSLSAFKSRLVKTEKEFKHIRKCILLLFSLVKDTYNAFASLIDHEIITTFQRTLISIGFVNSARNIFKRWISSQSEKVSKKLTHVDPSTVTTLEASIPESKEYDIQLEYMGDLMERTLGSTEDKRVLFKPDGWQKLLLDVIDSRSSALVCAPTASGKTYICYYAMEQVLRMDDFGVVIYVSPNTSLAFQVTYEITARFSSKIYRTTDVFCAPILSATFLEKFHDPKWKCAQIIVTIPQILEMLLFSLRSGEREFVRRIEYIIFDEIHCISHSDIGHYIERCLHLSCAPFLALSATIGNPSEFHKWLTKINQSRKLTTIGDTNEVYLSTFDERYSDLKLSIYSVKQGIKPLNPITWLFHSQIAENGFPSGFYLCPSDCYSFLTTLFKFAPESVKKEMDYLRPINYFNGSVAITKRQYRYFWGACMAEIERQVSSGAITNECLEQVYDYLQADKVESNRLAVFPEYVKKENSTTVPFKDYVLDDPFNAQNFIKLLKDLDKFSGLPCLSFILDRMHMEQLMISLVTTLEQAQHYKYYGTEEAALATKIENKRRLDKYNALVREYEMDSKLKTLSKEEKLEQGIDVNGLANEPLPPPPIDVAKEYDAEFNFSNRRIYTSYRDEVENFINMARAAIKGRFGAEEYIEGLRRGIGIHHEGLPHKYIMFTETLFRMGFLRVVIASRTLAFGVNMPCRSVVFVGDNYELNSLMYQQMSGRCGRRGFDLSGNVIFWSIPPKKIYQLLTAALPSLTCPDHSSSPTLLIRSLSLFETLVFRDASDETSARDGKARHSQQKSARSKKSSDLAPAQIIEQCRFEALRTEAVSRRIRSIYENPLALINDEDSEHKEALRTMSILYSSEILYKLGLLDQFGFPINCCEYLVLLHQEQHANLFIASALQSGLLHELLKSNCESLISEIAGQKFISSCSVLTPQNLPSLVLLALLSSVVNRHPLTGSIVTMKRLEIELDKLTKPSQSHVVSPEIFPLVAKLPAISKIIDIYNGLVSSVVEKYLLSLSKYNGIVNRSYWQLPLSHIKFGYDPSFSDIYSPFVCINPDVYKYKPNAVSDKIYLCQMIYKFNSLSSILSTENIVLIEENVIEFTTIIEKGNNYYLGETKEAYLCNSFMMDFWLSGKFDLVRDRNGLGQYAWSYLSKFLQFINFSRYLLSEYTSKSSSITSDDDVVFRAFDDLYKRIEPLFSRI